MKQLARSNPKSNTGAPLSLDYVRKVKAKHEAALLRKANVVSVGIGLAPAPSAKGSAAVSGGATPARRPILIVSVRRPVTPDSDDDGIPDQIEGVPVAVQVTGTIRAQ